MERDDVRHALRTPLTVIKGVLSLLARADDVMDPITRADLIARSVEQVKFLEAAIGRIEATFPSNGEDDVVIVLYEETADGVNLRWSAADTA
jgi:hypothetical protein